VQEALTNIARHASAERASVVICYTPDAQASIGIMKIKIDDDGAGFDLTNTARGLGLVGIRERVDVMYGTVKLRAAQYDGTHLEIAVPLSR